MTTYAVAMGKGGVGKTTTAAELAISLARRAGNAPVVAGDMDQQGNLTTRMGVGRDAMVTATMADVLRGDADVSGALIAGREPGVRVLAGTHELADVETAPPADLVTSLRDHLPGELARMGAAGAVLDLPPSVAGLALAGLAAADVVVMPVECAAEAYEQVGRLEAVIERLRRRVRPGLRIDWIVPTSYDGRRVLDREVVELLRERFPGRVTDPVRDTVMVRDSYTAGMAVSQYAPGSDVAADYARVTGQILGDAR